MILVSFELRVKVVHCQSPPEWAVTWLCPGPQQTVYGGKSRHQRPGTSTWTPDSQWCEITNTRQNIKAKYLAQIIRTLRCQCHWSVSVTMLFFFLVHVASIIIYLISTALHCTVMIVAMLNWQNFHYTLGKPSKNVITFLWQLSNICHKKLGVFFGSNQEIKKSLCLSVRLSVSQQSLSSLLVVS